MLLALAIVLVASHLILFHFVRRSGASHISLPSALVAGIVLLMITQHLGLFAVLIRFLLRRRS